MAPHLRSFVQSVALITVTAVVVGFLPALVGGTEAATAVPWVKSASVAGPTSIVGGGGTVVLATLSLPAAKFEVNAKVKLIANPGPTTITCQLALATASDSSATLVTTQATLPLMLTGSLSAPGDAVLSCGNSTGGTTVDASSVKVIAMKVGTLKTA
jgi:hypothetical protein